MLKISIVSYSNSLPFRWGLEQYAEEFNFVVSQDHPADCAKKLVEGQVDVGLVPVALLASYPELQVITDYGIAAHGEVATVKLYSNAKLEDLSLVKLDYQSMSSVNLCKVLFKEHWNLNPVYEATQAGFETQLGAEEAMVVIGDRCFELNGKFPYEYDLALEWEKFTGLPFVFAVWASRKSIDNKVQQQLNSALSNGIQQKTKALKYLPEEVHARTLDYWNQYIVFKLSKKAKIAYKSYLKKLSALKVEV